MKKSVFVTGATSGTGYSIAKRFAMEGYDVFITSRNAENAEKFAQELMNETNAFCKGYALEPGNEERVIEIFNDIRRQGYLIDTLVLNAAHLGINMEFFTVSLKDFMSVFETNLGWNFTIARQAAIHMKEKGKGSIVFIGSNTSYGAIPNRCAYGASKAAINGLVRSMALDLGKYNIRTNVVLAGMIKTTRWQQSDVLKKVPSNYTPIGDIAEFEDIANAAWFLGSDESKNTTGSELYVDGGMRCQLYPLVPGNENND